MASGNELRPLSRLLLGALCAAALIVGALVTHLALAKAYTPPIPSLVIVGALFIGGAVLLYLGNRVRKSLAGKGKPLSPLSSYRVVVSAQACALTAALLAGWSAGIMLSSVGQLEADLLQNLFLRAACQLAGSAFLLWVALLVESWCSLDEDDSDPGGASLADGTQPV